MSHQTPLAAAQATGRVNINPARFKDRFVPDDQQPLGDYPEKWDSNLAEGEVGKEHLIEHWNSFKETLTWLTKADSYLVELACEYRWKVLNTDKWLSIADKYLTVLGRLGATPVDRGKIYAPKKKDTDDPAEEFID